MKEPRAWLDEHGHLHQEWEGEDGMTNSRVEYRQLGGKSYMRVFGRWWLRDPREWPTLRWFIS